MTFVVVPNYISDQINQKLDAEIAANPGAEIDRPHLYQQVLAYFDEHGEIPDFTIAKATS